MEIKTYRITILIILFTISIISICSIMIAHHIEHFLRVGYFISNSIEDTIKNTNTPASISKKYIKLDEIINERYLYTLEKKIENTYNKIAGKYKNFDINYNSFKEISIQGNNFIFEIDNITIEIPTTEFYFDIWNHTQNIKYKEENNNIILASRKVIALTFDDGPSAKYTNQLLDILKSENTKATFFVLGKNAILYPEILKRESREGHEIGSHGFSHAMLTKLTLEEIKEELYNTDQAIYSAIGAYPRIFRPPYGATNTGVLDVLHMPVILWSIDPKDWKTHNKIKNIRAVENAKNGDIIIMHDIHSESIDSIQTIIQNLKNKGFEFVTISELLELNSENNQNGKICTKKGSCK